MSATVESPQEFGEELRRERELRDVSRETLAAVTKVSVRQIEALEKGRFEHLPAAVFSRGFVRAIALHLGLDAERTASAFLHVHREWQLGLDALERRASGITGTLPQLATRRRTLSSDSTVLGLGVAALLAIVTAGASALKSKSPDRVAGAPAASPTAAQSAAGPAALALPPAVAAATVALPPDAAPGAVPARSAAAAPAASPLRAGATGGLRLTLAFREDCWTEVRVDGKVVAAQLFRKGETQAYQAGRAFSLTVGDAGAVDVAVDGRALAALGSPGSVVRNYVIDQATLARRPVDG